MAWQSPKTNWTGTDGVRYDDLNRIEGNILELYKAGPAQADVTVYVSATAGSDTTGNGTSSGPYKTITKALESVSKNTNGKTIEVNIAAGTYDEDVLIRGFTGVLTMYSAGVVNVRSMLVEGCNVYQYGYQTNFKRGISLNYGASYIGQSLMYVSEASGIGISARNGSRFVLYNTATVSNTTSAAIEASGSSMIYISIVAGTNNTIGIRSDTGSVVGYGSMNMTATTQRISNTGGRIYTGSSLT